MNKTPSDAKPMQCPICGARLCDITPSPTMDITPTSNKQGTLTLKCRKCRKSIGIEIEFNDYIWS